MDIFLVKLYALKSFNGQDTARITILLPISFLINYLSTNNEISKLAYFRL